MSTRMGNVWKLVVALAVAAVLRCTYVHGQVSTLNYDNFFEFGVDTGDAELNEYGRSPTITLSTPIQLFGRTWQAFIVWTDGRIDFIAGPFTLLIYFEVDIRIEKVFYRETSNITLLQRARDQLQELFPSSGNFTPTTLFIVTWDKVAQFVGGYQANPLQAVIAADQQKTFVIFIYGDIQWSFPPFMVFFPGVGLDPLTNQDLNNDEGSNVNVTGMYIYQVDCSVVGPNNDAVGCCSLVDPLSGQVELSNITFGSTANYTCNQRYILSNGNSTRTCEANGYWSGSLPSCELNHPNFFDFGVNVGDAQMYGYYDARSPPTNLSTPIQFYGTAQHTLFIYRNGTISFKSPIYGRHDTLLLSDVPVIAPFWVRDLPTGNIFYRQTNDATLLQRASDQLQELFPSSGNFTPTTLFIATWENVARFQRPSQVNTFQVVIAADRQMTFVFFIYGDIQWGAGANIGFSAGDGTRSFMVPGALTNQVLNIDEGNNVGVTGVYIYRVDLCSVLGPSDVVGCCILVDPLSGQVELTTTTVGSTANYTCNQGYILSNGNSTRTCEANGYWSGSLPSCELNYTNFFDFVVNVSDAQLHGFYDARSPPTTLSTPIQFYGTAQHTLFIHTNGIISFNSPIYWYWRHETLLLSDIPVIAPFRVRYLYEFTGNIFYRQTNDATLLQRAHDQLQELFPSSGNFTPTTLLIATWENVARFGSPSQVNTFQVVIAADRQMTFVFFIYGDIQWGAGANIGFSAGDGTRFFMVPGALTNQTLNIDEGSNVGVTGVYIYRVDLCSVLGPSDAIQFQFLRNTNTVYEGDFMVPLTIQLQLKPPGATLRCDFIISLSVSSGSATEGDDFHLLRHEVTFVQGATTGNTQNASIDIIDDYLVEETESFVVSGNITAPASFVPGRDTTTVNILDNDEAVIGFNQTTYTFGEGDGTVEVCAAFLDPGQTAPNVVVELMGSISPNTTAEKDFEILNATALLGNNRGCFRIDIVDDSDPEPAENFTISFVVSKVQPEGVNISINQSEAVIIIQENDLFQVQFLHNSTIVNESDAASSVSISVEILVAPFAILPSNIHVTVSETPEDFSLSTNELVFLAGANNGTVKTFVITIHDDDLVEGTETFVISGSVTPPAMFLPGRNMTTITIMDNEYIQVQFHQTSTEACEDEDSRVFLQILVIIVPPTAILGTEVTFNFSVVGGNATVNEDFHLVFQRLTLCQGTSNNNVQSLVVDIIDDFLVEGTESFVISGDATAPASFVPGRDSVTVTILDNDAIQVQFLRNTSTVDEGEFVAPLTIQLQLTPADATLQFNIIITLSVSSGSATECEDFHLLRQEVTFDQGATTGNTQSASIEIIDDALVEETESFVVSGNVTAPASFVPGGDTVTVNILDNDAIQVEFLLNTTTAMEDTVVFLDIQFRLIPPNVTLQEPIIVTVAVVNGSASEGDDFSLINSMLTFNTNMTFDQGANDSNVQVLAINILDDQLLEGTESFVVSGSVTAPASFVPGRDTVTVDILDNDVIQVQFLQNTSNVDEGDFMAPLTIQLQLTPADETLQFNIIITLSVSSRSATDGNDFHLLRQEVTFDRGATTGNTQNVSVDIIDDSLVEGTESFVVSGNVTVLASFVPGGNTTTVNILDNDAIQVELLLNTTTAREASVIFLDIQFQLIPPNVTLQEPIIVTVAVVNGSATEGDDFSLANSTITFDQGANDSHIQVLAINISDDQLLEGTENFVISGHVTAPGSFVPGGDVVTVDILDNDVAVIGFNQTSYTFGEGDSTVEVCAVFLQPRDPSEISPTVDRSIQLIGSTSPDTANGSDFQLYRTMSNRCFGITIKEDNDPEPTEQFNISFSVNLVQVDGVNINNFSEAIIFIQDDDVAVIGFNQTAYTFEEGDGTVEVCAVFLDPGQTAPNVVVELMGSISPNTTADNDFEIFNPTVLLGNNRGCFRIDIVDDSDPEPAENFTISFVVSKVQPEGVNISINQSEAVIIIQENDLFQVQFLRNSTIVNESAAASSVNISVEILVASFAILPSNINVTLSETPEDFSLSTNELVFLAGTNNGTIQNLGVSIHDDNLVEGTETFVISGSVTSPAMFLPGRNMTTITILDNEQIQVQFQQNSTEAREDEDQRKFLDIQVQIQPPTAILKTEVTLSFSVVAGNAKENEDFCLVFQRLTLCQGTSNGNVQSLAVDITRDFLVEGTESFVISGNATAPASFVPGRESITVTILDNDAIQVQFLMNTSTVHEGDFMVPLTIQLQLTPREATLEYNIIIALSVSSGSATECDDFRLLGQEVTFDQGTTTGNTQSVSIKIVDDSLVEETENFVVSGNVTAPASFVFGGDTVTVNILDNDAIQVEFLLNTATAREDGVIFLDIQYLLIPPNVTLQEPIIVTVAVVNGSATEDEDFSLTNSSLTFDTNMAFDQGANDSNVQVLAINISDDQLVEGTESFVVSGNVTAPATLGRDTVTVGILDNDVAVIGFNQTTYTFEESDGTVEVCTTFTDPSKIAPNVVVELMGSTSPGTANSSDFQLDLDRNLVTVTNNASDRGRCFRINITEDSDRETTEQFNISFNVSSVQPDGVNINTSSEAIIFIQDDDDAPPPSGTSPSEATSSTDTGAVIGGTLLGVLALVVLVTALLGCLIYYKRRKGRKLNRRVLDETSSHTHHLRNREVEMQQFDIHRAKDELNEEATRYLQDFPEEMIFHTSNLHLLDSVGQGEFGIVYRARLTRSTLRKTESEIVAVKTIKGFLDPSEVANILKECLKMKAFVHPHLMGILGICLAGQAPYIVMPFMANGSLHSYLRKHRAELLLSEDEDIDLVCKTQKRMIDMCLQIAKGMEYLTEHKLVHRDLAARNCMLDQNYVLKVADFGLSENTYAKSYFRQEQTAGLKLPVKWMAYESLTDGIFSEKTDVWSFGVTCWEIFSTAKTPYPGIHPTSLIAQLENGERLPKPYNAACCDSMYEVMLSCWDVDPEQRPTFTQLVTTITSVLDPLADYLDVTTFVTGEEQETETAIMESQVVESDEEASKEENNADLQGGAHDGARGIGRERRSVLMKFGGQLQKALTFNL